MPAPRIYSTSPSGGVDYSAQIEALVETVNGLQEQIETLEENSRATVNEIQPYNVTGPVTGNIEITLAHTPVLNSVEIDITTGPELYLGADFILTGNKITLLANSPVVNVLASGDVLSIKYSRLA